MEGIDNNNDDELQINLDVNKLDKAFRTWKSYIEVILYHHELYYMMIGVERLEDLHSDLERKRWKRKMARASRIIRSTLGTSALLNLSWLIPPCNLTLFQKLCATYGNLPNPRGNRLKHAIFEYKVDYTMGLVEQCLEPERDVKILRKKTIRKKRKKMFQPYRKYLKFKYIL